MLPHSGDRLDDDHDARTHPSSRIRRSLKPIPSDLSARILDAWPAAGRSIRRRGDGRCWWSAGDVLPAGRTSREADRHADAESEMLATRRYEMLEARGGGPQPGRASGG